MSNNFRPPTACKCGRAAESGTVCSACKHKPTAHTERPLDYRREWTHLYNCARWKNPKTGLRAAVLRKHPICVLCCRNPSTVADHVTDHRGNLQLFWDTNNLQGVCDPCHFEKIGRTHGRGGRTTDGPACLINGLVAGQ